MHRCVSWPYLNKATISWKFKVLLKVLNFFPKVFLNSPFFYDFWMFLGPFKNKKSKEEYHLEGKLFNLQHYTPVIFFTWSKCTSLRLYTSVIFLPDVNTPLCKLIKIVFFTLNNIFYPKNILLYASVFYILIEEY